MVTRLPGEAMESMGPSSVNGEPSGAGAAGGAQIDADLNAGHNTGTDPSTDTTTLLEQLRADRLWLLQQIDGGRWPDLRLDLAALERELGQLLEQAQDKLSSGARPRA